MATPAQTTVFKIQRAGERYHADHGWLKTYHSFSFADYFDPNNMNWGALRVLNDDLIGPGEGFPLHPHRDMEILTYVLEGELEHRDSMSNHGVVGPGCVQFMSAGTGVRHSEYNHSPDKPLHLVQMWLQPGKLGVPPAYGQREFTTDDRRNRWLVVASGQDGVEAPIQLTQTATFKVTTLEGGKIALDFAPGRLGFLFVAAGDVQANGNALGAGDAVRIANLDRLDVEGNGELIFWDLPLIEV